MARPTEAESTARSVTGFLWPVRVYYEDTDSGGVVYYANYLKFMERARTELLRHHGFEQDELRAREKVIFAVRSVQVDYLAPARFNDLLQVRTEILQAGRASLTFGQDVLREADGRLLCRGEVKVACLDSETFRARAIPDAMQTIIEGSPRR